MADLLKSAVDSFLAKFEDLERQNAQLSLALEVEKQQNVEHYSRHQQVERSNKQLLEENKDLKEENAGIIREFDHLQRAQSVPVQPQASAIISTGSSVSAPAPVSAPGPGPVHAHAHAHNVEAPDVEAKLKIALVVNQDLACHMREKDSTIELLQTKNANLKHNFYLLEGKYKSLRDEIQRSTQRSPVSVLHHSLADTHHEGKGQGQGEEKEKENVMLCMAAPVHTPHSKKKLQRAQTITGAAAGRSSVVDSAGSGGGSGGKSLKRSYTVAAPNASNCNNSSSSKPKQPKIDKRQQVVRKKSEREALPGHDCEECQAFYAAIQASGVVGDSKEALKECMQSCSRHKHQFTPPTTPEGFWSNNMSMPTPEK